jgi:hypothetical protein
MKKSRRHQRRETARSKKKAQFQFESFGISEADHPKYKAAMAEAARLAEAEFPKTLELVKEQLRQHDPIGIMACLVGYGLSVFSGPGSDRKPIPEIQQHHAELLLAILLTLPADQWTSTPVVPDVMQIIFDNVPKLSDAFFLQRTLDGESATSEQERAVLFLQERIRFHTMGVRNWGYFGDVVQISKELYGAIDAPFAAHHGFSCTDLIEVARCMVAEFERQQTEHWDQLRKVLRGRNPRQIFRHYFKYVPGLVGDAETMLASMPGIDRDGAKAAVMAHSDLRLANFGTFEPAELAKLPGRDVHVVEAALRAISRAPGGLAETKIEHLFLGNPIWEAPGVDLGESFFVPMPQAIFSHIHRIMERLASAAGLKEAVEKARAEYLEKKLETTLRLALPGSVINPGAKWKVGEEEFETDVLAVIDRTVVVAEAKSNRLTPEGLRGAPARVKRHIQEMVLAPSIQSERLANLIADARRGDATALATVTGLGIEPDKVDRVIRLSVTLYDFSVLTSAEGELKKVGWVPADHDLAPTILIADLQRIVDILDQPLLLLHYLSERTHFQKAFNLMGDELDFLGLYLQTGFNFGISDKDAIFSPSGMSAPIDRYYQGLDGEHRRSKPRPDLSRLFTQVIGRLNERRPPGWTTIGLHLLSAASPSEQRRLERSLDTLRAMVRKDFRDPKHVNSVQMQPPQKYKARVGFYLFPEELRADYKKTMEHLAREALEADGVEAVVLFGRSTERWDVPYEAALYATPRNGSS